MTVLQIVGCVVSLVVCVLLIIIVLSQQGRDAYLGGAIAGGAAESFLGKKKARSIDSMLGNLTKVFGVAFIVVTILMDILFNIKQ